MQKLYRVILVIVILSIESSLAGKAQSKIPESSDDLKKFFSHLTHREYPLIIAHRGGPVAGYPENSLEGFQYTWQLNPEAILEMDVRMTSDSILVLLHDETLDRTTTGKGLVTNKAYSALKSLKLTDIQGNVAFSQIPLFEDILKWAKGKAMLAIDAKPGTDLKRVIKLIEKTKSVSNLFIICYSVEDAVFVLKQNPDFMVALGFNSKSQLDMIKKSGIPYSNLIALTPAKLLEKSFYDEIHKMGIVCAMGTYGKGNPDESPESEAAQQYLYIVQYGIDIITTDKPLYVRSVFEKAHK
jgi:glycerophosphoryl diester phosphodiesterase